MFDYVLKLCGRYRPQTIRNACKWESRLVLPASGVRVGGGGDASGPSLTAASACPWPTLAVAVACLWAQARRWLVWRQGWLFVFLQLFTLEQQLVVWIRHSRLWNVCVMIVKRVLSDDAMLDRSPFCGTKLRRDGNGPDTSLLAG